MLISCGTCWHLGTGGSCALCRFSICVNPAIRARCQHPRDRPRTRQTPREAVAQRPRPSPPRASFVCQGCRLRAAPCRPTATGETARLRARSGPRGSRAALLLRMRRRARSTARRRGKVCSRLLSPVVVPVSRLLFGRPVRSEETARASRRAGPRATRAGASASRVVHHRRSRAGASSRWRFLLGSLVLSPVVVLVSRLLSRRRSVRSEGAARAS